MDGRHRSEAHGENQAKALRVGRKRTPVDETRADWKLSIRRVCTLIGFPSTIRVDQGNEFISRDMDLWAYHTGVTLDFSRPGKPTDNAFIDAFNGRFRAECLKAHWFMSLSDAADKIEIGAETTTKNAHIAQSGTTSLQRS